MSKLEELSDGAECLKLRYVRTDPVHESCEFVVGPMYERLKGL